MENFVDETIPCAVSDSSEEKDAVNISPLLESEDKTLSTSKKNDSCKAKHRKPAKNAAKVTTRDFLLKWNDYYGSREFGIWIQCCKMDCGKWRWVREYEEPHQVPELWFCHMNKDPEFNDCRKPETNYTQYESSSNLYQPGAVVWAQVTGYPCWPAMVEDDPDAGDYYEEVQTSSGKIRKKYHVTFLDQTVTRAWVPESKIKVFLPGDKFPELQKKHKVCEKNLKQAYKTANLAMNMTLGERLKKFSFASTYTGKWPTIKDPNCDEEERNANLQHIFDSTLALIDEVENLEDLENIHPDEPKSSNAPEEIIAPLNKLPEEKKSIHMDSMSLSQDLHKNKQKSKKEKMQNEKNYKLVTKSNEVSGADESQYQAKYHMSPDQKGIPDHLSPDQKGIPDQKGEEKKKETRKRKFRESKKVAPRKPQIHSTIADIESSINRAIVSAMQEAEDSLTVQSNMAMCNEDYFKENNIESDNSVPFYHFEEGHKTMGHHEDIPSEFSLICEKVSFLDSKKTEENVKEVCNTVFHCSEENETVGQFIEVNEADKTNVKTSIPSCQKSHVKREKKSKNNSSLDLEKKKKIRKTEDLCMNSEVKKQKQMQEKNVKAKKVLGLTRKIKGFKPPVIKSHGNENEIQQLDNADTLAVSMNSNQIDQTSSVQAICMDRKAANCGQNFHCAEDKKMNFDKKNCCEENEANSGQGQIETQINTNELSYHVAIENSHFCIDKNYEHCLDSEDSCPFEGANDD